MKPTVLVVGGGIIGLSIAAVLQRDGMQVTLVDAHKIGSGASFGNAGHLATEQVYPVADPSIFKHLPKMLIDPLGPLRVDWRYLPKLLPWMSRLVLNMRPENFLQIHETLKRMNSVSLAAWDAMVQDFDLQSWVHVQGSLLVAEKAKTLGALQEHADKLNALGVPTEYWSAQALQDAVPVLAPNQIGGLFFPQTGHVSDLVAMMRRLQQVFVELGGQIVEDCKVTAIKPISNHKVRVMTAAQFFDVDKVVVAMGAHAKDLVKDITGVNVPLDTERGYHYMLPQEKNRLNIPIASADRRFIMTPMEGGLRLAGTVEYAGLQAAPNMQRARQLLQLAKPMLKEDLNVQEATEWMGFRPTIVDSLPVIDRFGSVYFAFGHQHLGLTHAAVTAQLMRSLMRNEKPLLDLHPYRLNRF